MTKAKMMVCQNGREKWVFNVSAQIVVLLAQYAEPAGIFLRLR